MNQNEKRLRNIVETFREKYSSLSPELVKKLPRFNDFSSVCQLELVQIENPVRQILLITRFEDEKDLDIEIHDPVPDDGILKKMEEITMEKKWEKLLEPQFVKKIPNTHKEERYYKYYLEQAFIEIYQYQLAKDYSKYYRPTLITQHALYLTDEEPNKISYWLIYGSITDYKPDGLVDLIFKELELQNQDEINNINVEVNEKAEGFFSFIYPPIWLDELPGFMDMAIKSREQHKRLILNFYYGESTILLYKDGGIGIIGKDKNVAMRKLNEIMGILLLSNVPTYSIRDNDITTSIWKLPDYFQETLNGLDYSIRTCLFDDRQSYSRIMYPYEWRRQINSTILMDLITSNSDIPEKVGIDFITLYIEAFTHLREKQYIQSFMLSWVIIERLINEYWKKYLKERGFSNNRVKNLSESPNWTASIKIETKNLLGLITNEEYGELSRLRKIRNDFMHEEGEITEDDTKRCFHWCNELIKRKLLRST